MASLLSGLYTQRKFAVWVEDLPTRDYLSAVWQQPPEIGLLVANGRRAVEAAVHDARSNGAINVFGIVDRDHGRGNREDWPNQKVFKISVHEIENYVLDGDALQAAGLGPAAKVDARMLEAAESLAWATACMQTLSALRAEQLRGSPAGAPRTIQDVDQARLHIVTSPWFATWADRPTEDAVVAKLQAAREAIDASFTNGTWRQELPGKELLIAAMGGRKRMTAPDVIKTVAAWQVSNGRVPAELADLRAEILGRV